MTLKQTLLLASSTILLTVASAHAPGRRPHHPPPRPVERVPPPPPTHRDFVWVAGYHRWDGREYVWVPAPTNIRLTPTPSGPRRVAQRTRRPRLARRHPGADRIPQKPYYPPANLAY